MGLRVSEVSERVAQGQGCPACGEWLLNPHCVEQSAGSHLRTGCPGCGHVVEIANVVVDEVVAPGGPFRVSLEAAGDG